MNRTYEDIILGIGEKGGVFFFFLAASFLSFFFSFYLIGKPNPHIPPIHLYPKKIVISKVDSLYLSKSDMFLHKTCMLAEFIGCLRKLISLSYELLFCSNLIGR